MKYLNGLKLGVLLFLSVSTLPPTVSAEDLSDNREVDTQALCAGYYQLMAMGYNAGGRVSDATLADKYTALYDQQKIQASQTHKPQQWLAKMYAAMSVLLAEIDQDYHRYRELKPRYQAQCEPESPAQPDAPFAPSHPHEPLSPASPDSPALANPV